MIKLGPGGVVCAAVTVGLILTLPGCSRRRTSDDAKPAEQAQTQETGSVGGAATTQRAQQFQTPWEHEDITGLARVFLERGGQEIAKGYPQIPPEHLARLESEYSSHRGPSEKAFSKLSKAEIVALYLVVGRFWVAETWKQEDEGWQSCVFYTARDGTTVAASFQVAHPVLAEYHQKAIISPPGLPQVELPLPMNVGGRTEINVYFYGETNGTGPFLRLQDRRGETLIDLRRRVSRLIVREEGIPYAGDLESESPSISWTSEGDGQVSVSVDDAPAEQLTGALAGPGEYLGRLDGTKGPIVFVPASVEKERRIQALFDID